jgi:hypothetical protein
MSQIEDVHAVAIRNGWTPEQLNDWPEQSRQYTRNGTGITIWHGPKGRVSSADTSTRGSRGLRFRPIHPPQLFAKVISELESQPEADGVVASVLLQSHNAEAPGDLS